METLGWAVMALVIWSVWAYSAGHARRGNWLTLYATTLAMIFFMNTGHWSFFTLHMILFLRAAWMVLGIKITLRA